MSNPLQAIDTRKELAKTVGVGEVTMGRAMKIEDEAPQSVKDALNKDDITIHQGYQITRQLQELPEEEREQAAAEAISREIAKHEERKRTASHETRIAKLFCAAFEKGVQIDPTRENFHIWVENAGVRQSHYESIANDARQIAAAFTTLAELLEEGAKDEQSLQKST